MCSIFIRFKYLRFKPYNRNTIFAILFIYRIHSLIINNGQQTSRCWCISKSHIITIFMINSFFFLRGSG